MSNKKLDKIKLLFSFKLILEKQEKKFIIRIKILKIKNKNI